MKVCQPCNQKFAVWSKFVRHLVDEHGLDRETVWRRANQIGDLPCCAVSSRRGRWLMFVQDGLGL